MVPFMSMSSLYTYFIFNSLNSFLYLQSTDLPGLHGWHWEVAITYADILADICIHGNTSTIQKMALLGTNKEMGGLHRIAVIPKCPMPSAGLLDLVYFHAAEESFDGSEHEL